MNEFGKIPHHAPFPVHFYDSCHVAWGHAINSIGWGNYIRYHHSIFPLPSFHFSSHLPFTNIFFFQRYYVALCFISIDIHIGMIHKYAKGISYTQWCFLMNIDSLSIPTSKWVNYYHNNKRTNNEINVVYTRTNILYIHGCHTRTNHNKILVVTHVNPILEIFIIITQSLN